MKNIEVKVQNITKLTAKETDYLLDLYNEFMWIHDNLEVNDKDKEYLAKANDIKKYLHENAKL